MAIAKMKKITLISFHEKREQLLMAIQTLQSWEVIDLPSATDTRTASSPKERELIEQSIKKLDAQLESADEALAFLQPYLEKDSMRKKLTTKKQELSLDELEKAALALSPETVIAEVSGLKDELKKLEDSKKRLYEEESFLSQWRNLSFNPNETRKFEHIAVKVGTVPQSVTNEYSELLKASPFAYVEEVFQNKESVGVMLIFEPAAEADVNQLLEKTHFQPLAYNYAKAPKEMLEDVQAAIQQNNELNVQTRKNLSTMKTEEWQLMLLSEYYYAKLQRVKSQLMVLNEKHLFVMQGWLEEDRVEGIKATLAKEFPIDTYALLVEDVQEDEIKDVPTVLKNNKIVAPFESVTAMYSMPKYDEIDPTPLLTPFYLLFFGMMVADFGYGLLLFIGTFIALKFLQVGKGMRNNLKFFHLLSYPSMLWGLVYGSFFGIEMPVVLLSTSNDANTILLISVIFGIIQIMFGLGIKAYLLLRDKNALGAISDSIGWLGILLGIILLLIGKMILPSQILSTVGAALAITSAVGIVLATAMASDNKALGFGAGLYNLYGITSYIGDIVSYTRLMALGVSGGSIAVAFNLIIDFMPAWAKFTIGAVLFVVLHSINFGLSMLSGYVHGARLTFVEFFGKFYEGGGRALNPLKATEKYIDIKK